MSTKIIYKFRCVVWRLCTEKIQEVEEASEVTCVSRRIHARVYRWRYAETQAELCFERGIQCFEAFNEQSTNLLPFL